MCLNKNVLVGAVIAAVAVLLLAPQLWAAALPLLVLAICPISMVLMMKGMSSMEKTSSGSRPTEPRPADHAAGRRAGDHSTDSGFVDDSTDRRAADDENPKPSPDLVARVSESPASISELQAQLRDLRAKQIGIEDQLEAHARESL